MKKLNPKHLALMLAGALVLVSLALCSKAEAQAPIINGEATVTLTWTPPTQNEDGSALAASDIGGYVIYYDTGSRFSSAGVFRPGCSDRPVGTRTDASCYPNVIDLTDGSAQSQVVTLTVDQDTTFYFAATAFAANGEWSRYSNEALKSVVLVITDLVPNPPIIQSIDMVISCTTDLPTVTCEFIVQ